MRKVILLFLVLISTSFSYSQENSSKDVDAVLKKRIYETNKKKVVNFSKKEFDKLFFEFFEKKTDPDLILTKEEFYNYTMRIAIFSDRLAALYPQEKESAEESKKMWSSENYEDYLVSKQTQKK